MERTSQSLWCVALQVMLSHTLTATNTGSLQLRNLAFSIPTVTDLTCSYKASNVSQTEAPLDASVVLELDAIVICIGSYNFIQDDI